MRSHVVSLIVLIVVLTDTASAAALPAPGSTYHLLFATAGLYRTTTSTLFPPPAARFHLIAGADYHVTEAAANVELPGTLNWNGATIIYRAILSISGDNARDRLSVTGPVFNMHGTQLATGHADLFDGNIAAPVAYDEVGNLITSNTDVWTGCTSVGTSAAASCGDWNNVSSAAGGRIGNATESNALWMTTGSNKACNLGSRLYGLSLALTAPLWGDYDGSGKVDGRDFLEWQRYFGAGPNTSTLLPPAFNAARSFLDGNTYQPVGAADLAVWQEHYGQSLPVAIQSVPEPGGGMLAIGLMLGTLPLRRRFWKLTARQ